MYTIHDFGYTNQYTVIRGETKPRVDTLRLLKYFIIGKDLVLVNVLSFYHMFNRKAPLMKLKISKVKCFEGTQ